jgi:hypothetical protein
MLGPGYYLPESEIARQGGTEKEKKKKDKGSEEKRKVRTTRKTDFCPINENISC